MPLDAWVLLAVSVGLGLTLEVLFITARLRGRGRADVKSPEDGGATGGGSP